MMQWIAVAVAAALAVSAVPLLASAEPDAKTEQAAPSLEWMVGEWRGPGMLFGRASAVVLTVRPIINGAGYSLDYSVTVAAEGGKPEMRFAAHGFYQVGKGKKWQGRWVDNFGNLHDISGDVADGRLTTVWGSPSTEIGRSSYVREGNSLRVTDWSLRKTGSFEEFASSTLSRD